MNSAWIIIVVVAVPIIVGLAVWVGRASRSRAAARTCLANLSAWSDLEPIERIERLDAWLSRDGRRGFERAAGLVMLGCAWLDRDQCERAARPFQMAYHADAGCESAMVLAFACMKVSQRNTDQFLPTLIETWNEVGRPCLPKSSREREMLDAFRGDPSLAGATSMASAFASLPSTLLRERIRAALSDRPTWARALWDSSRSTEDRAETDNVYTSSDA